MKQYAFIGDETTIQNIHNIGLPRELSSGTPRQMPRPDFIILRDSLDGDGYKIDRFTFDGENVGDTWHIEIEDAREQATHEYGNVCWRDIPEWVADVVGYVRTIGDKE